jgi:hypothetical protein
MPPGIAPVAAEIEFHECSAGPRELEQIVADFQRCPFRGLLGFGNPDRMIERYTRKSFNSAAKAGGKSLLCSTLPRIPAGGLAEDCSGYLGLQRDQFEPK